VAYSLEDKLVIAVSARALFDLEESNRIFETEGPEAYRDHQRRNQDVTLGKGVAYPFVRRLLALNGPDANDRPIEVMLLSRNDPDTGLSEPFKTLMRDG